MRKTGLETRMMAVMVAASLLASCGAISFMEKVQEDKRKEYRASESLPDLEVPPDLLLESDELALDFPEPGEQGAAATGAKPDDADDGLLGQDVGLLEPQERDADAPAAATAADAPTTAAPAAAAAPAPSAAAATDDTIEIDAPADKLWPVLKGYFESRGRSLIVDDISLGVLETSWSVPYLSQDNMLRNRVSVLVEPGSTESMTRLAFHSDLQTFVKGGDEGSGDWQLTGRATEIEEGVKRELQQYISEQI